MTDIWVTSDHHFSHNNIIDYCNRPFKDKHEMNVALTEKWNSVIKPNDLVFYLGDFGMGGSKQLESIIQRLNGRKVLIYGNHDKQLRKDWAEPYFEWRQPYHEESLYGRHCVFFHYPIESWNGKYRGSLHFHGHSHGQSTQVDNRIDVGVDTNKFMPYNIREVIDNGNICKHNPSEEN